MTGEWMTPLLSWNNLNNDAWDTRVGPFRLVCIGPAAPITSRYRCTARIDLDRTAPMGVLWEVHREVDTPELMVLAESELQRRLREAAELLHWDGLTLTPRRPLAPSDLFLKAPLR